MQIGLFRIQMRFSTMESVDQQLIHFYLPAKYTTVKCCFVFVTRNTGGMKLSILYKLRRH